MSIISLHELSILLVAPSRVLAAVLQKELGDMGALQTVCCKNITDALVLMRDKKPDLVVSSMYFEDGDGIDFITAMRAEILFEDTLFMLISGEDRFEMLNPIRQAGVVAILPRPFTQQALSHALNTALGYLEDRVVSIDHKKLTALKILLVDDSRLARKHMANVLEKLGITSIQITYAENGIEAIEKLATQHIDIVITDYNMPVMDGEELLKYIRQNEALDHLPVIMLTSEQNEAILASIKSHGVTAMLNKPFDPPNLKALLEVYLD